MVTKTAHFQRQGVYKQSLTYNGSTYYFLLYDGAKVICIQQKLYLEFWSLTGLEICIAVLSHDAGPWQSATASSQPHNQEDKQPILYSALYCQHCGVLCFLFLHSIMSTKHLCVFPASGEKKKR